MHQKALNIATGKDKPLYRGGLDVVKQTLEQLNIWPKFIEESMWSLRELYNSPDLREAAFQQIKSACKDGTVPSLRLWPASALSMFFKDPKKLELLKQLGADTYRTTCLEDDGPIVLSVLHTAVSELEAKSAAGSVTTQADDQASLAGSADATGGATADASDGESLAPTDEVWPMLEARFLLMALSTLASTASTATAAIPAAIATPAPPVAP